MNIRKYTPTIGALALAGLTGCGGNAFTAVKENLQSAMGYDAMVEKLSDKTLILRIGNYEPNNRVGFTARSVALRLVPIFLAGTLLGSLAPESGNVLAFLLGLPPEKGHIFNPVFLAIGIIGIVLALFLGYKHGK